MTTWRKELKMTMKEHNDSFDQIIANTMTDEEMDVEFDDDFGTSEGIPFTVWTATRVYFPVVYDGAEWVGSVARFPDGVATEHFGAQYPRRRGEMDRIEEIRKNLEFNSRGYLDNHGFPLSIADIKDLFSALEEKDRVILLLQEELGLLKEFNNNLKCEYYPLQQRAEQAEAEAVKDNSILEGISCIVFDDEPHESVKDINIVAAVMEIRKKKERAEARCCNLEKLLAIRNSDIKKLTENFRLQHEKLFEAEARVAELEKENENFKDNMTYRLMSMQVMGLASEASSYKKRIEELNTKITDLESLLSAETQMKETYRDELIDTQHRLSAAIGKVAETREAWNKLLMEERELKLEAQKGLAAAEKKVKGIECLEQEVRDNESTITLLLQQYEQRNID